MERRGKTFLANFTGGAVSGALTTTLFQPLDLIKTRMQVATVAMNPIPAIPGQAVSINIFGTFSNVLRDEKWRGLWKGTAPSISRCIPGIGLYFGAVNTLKGIIVGKTGRPLKMYESLAVGFLSRTAVTLSVMPVSVIKTRFESGRFGYSSQMQALSHIVRKEGFRGFYKGSKATVLRDAPFSGLYLMFYMQSKLVMANFGRYQELSPFQNLACGIFAGMMASIITQPADVIKTYQQVDQNNIKGVFEVLSNVVRSNGTKGLFTGVVPRMLRRSCMAAFTWTFYEEIIKVVNSALIN